MSDDPFATDPSDEVPVVNSTESFDAPPTQIGRFRIESVLGRGGFGVVYLATDEQLQRKVAIKLPHPRLVQRPEDREQCPRGPHFNKRRRGQEN